MAFATAELSLMLAMMRPPGLNRCPSCFQTSTCILGNIVGKELRNAYGDTGNVIGHTIGNTICDTVGNTESDTVGGSRRRVGDAYKCCGSQCCPIGQHHNVCYVRVGTACWVQSLVATWCGSMLAPPYLVAANSSHHAVC